MSLEHWIHYKVDNQLKNTKITTKISHHKNIVSIKNSGFTFLETFLC